MRAAYNEPCRIGPARSKIRDLAMGVSSLVGMKVTDMMTYPKPKMKRDNNLVLLLPATFMNEDERWGSLELSAQNLRILLDRGLLSVSPADLQEVPGDADPYLLLTFRRS